MNDDKKRKLEKDIDFKNLTLIDNDFFVYAIQNNLELADILIKPVLNHLGITDYKIISVIPEKTYTNFINRDVRFDCVIELNDESLILVELQNTHSERMTFKRIRYEQSVHDARYLKPGEDFSKLPNIISMVYTVDPLEELDNGNPIAELVLYDLISDKIMTGNQKRTFVINGKYKSKDFKEFTDVIEDLKQSNIDKIRNPVIKDIHLKIKETKEGEKMWSEYVEKRYGKELRELREQITHYQAALLEKDKRIAELEAIQEKTIEKK